MGLTGFKHAADLLLKVPLAGKVLCRDQYVFAFQNRSSKFRYFNQSIIAHQKKKDKTQKRSTFPLFLPLAPAKPRQYDEVIPRACPGTGLRMRKE